MGDVPTQSGNSLMKKHKKTRIMTFGGGHNSGLEFSSLNIKTRVGQGFGQQFV